MYKKKAGRKGDDKEFGREGIDVCEGLSGDW